jgi:hypothetical protein
MWSRPIAWAASGAVDVSPLAARIEALEGESARARQIVDADHLTPPPPSERETRMATADPRVDDLIAALERLEKSVAEARTAASARSQAQAIIDKRAEVLARTVDDLSRQAHDLAETEERRLEALGGLRGQRLDDGTDARLPVLDDMIRMAQTSANGATRADVRRQLSHVTDARLKQPLLNALASDPDPKSREEAAETLADFLPDAQVESALRAAMQNDAATKVRKQAAESLAGGR